MTAWKRTMPLPMTWRIVSVLRPPARRRGAEVVDERVEPHVDDLIGIAGYRDAPVPCACARPRHADVAHVGCRGTPAPRCDAPRGRCAARRRRSAHGCARRTRESRKYQFSSSTHSGGASCSVHAPSTNCSHPLQYQPAYGARYRSPAAAHARQIASTTGRWRGSALVRMKSSYETSSVPASAANSSALRATNAATSSPAAAAACATFGACSSVPVRKRTARPRARAWRAIASVCTSSSACPRCGGALTNGIAVVR